LVSDNKDIAFPNITNELIYEVDFFLQNKFYLTLFVFVIYNT